MVGKGQFSHIATQKRLREDPVYCEKKNEDAKKYYQDNKEEIKRKKKELYNQRMCILKTSNPQDDKGCYTVY